MFVCQNKKCLSYKSVCLFEALSHTNECAIQQACPRCTELASIHARAGCKLSVHGTKKRSHKDARCKYVTHGPSPLSKLITPFSVQRKKQNTKTKINKRSTKKKGPRYHLMKCGESSMKF